ncbi:hypothetical protein ACVWZM_001553 [Bradyrhizobium sp. USDA 4501]
MVKSSDIRFRIDPGDVPPEKAARRLHLTLARFNELLPNLLKRGFPPADPDTGMFDLERIDEWRAARHSRPEPEPRPSPPEPRLSPGERLARKIRERYQQRNASKPDDNAERMIAVIEEQRKQGRKRKLTPP